MLDSHKQETNHIPISIDFMEITLKFWNWTRLEQPSQQATLEVEGPQVLKIDGAEFFRKIPACLKMSQKAQNGSICLFVRYDSTFFQDWLISFFNIPHEVDRL